MFSTLLESGRARWWRPAHSAVSLTAHAATAAVVLTFGGAGPRGGPPPSKERTSYATLRFLDPVARTPTAGRGPVGDPKRIRVLGAPSRVPVGLPPVPAVDLAVLTVVSLGAIPTYYVDPTRFGPTESELLAGASDATARETMRGYPPSAAERAEHGLIPLADNPEPEYPEQLRMAGIDGEVRVAFMVDTAGVPDPKSLRVIASTHFLFTRAVRRVLPRLHFIPAQSGEVKVAMLVEQPFVFVTR